MCETYDTGIEHPNQSWYIRALGDQLEDEHKQALIERYADVPPHEFDVRSLFDALNRVTQQVHLIRDTHERGNRARLGIYPPSDDEQPHPLWAEYDNMTGRSEKVGHFISWFSHVSHTAYVQQESFDERHKFVHVSLELGGKRQFGDWDAADRVDAMAKSIPRQLLEAEPMLLHMQVFGESMSQRVKDTRVEYDDEANKSYLISPLWREATADQGSVDNLKFDFLKVRRRRPFADIFIEGQSDVVLFKESWGLIPMAMLHPQMRTEIVADVQYQYISAYKRLLEERRYNPEAQERSVKIQDTPGAKLAGRIFETALKSGYGVTKAIIPVETHLVQAVGEKYSEHRYQAA